MEVIEAIMNRRSIRKYTGEKVADDQIDLLLKAGMYAPSAVNKQPWHFIVFRDRNIINDINKIHPNSYMLKDSDVAILVCWDENLQHDTGYGPVDCSAATQNILLAAYGIGLGAVWVGLYPRQHRIEGVHKLFGLPGHVKPFSIISIGYPAEKKEFPDRYKKERVHYEKW
jgi:nitroreductase